MFFYASWKTKDDNKKTFHEYTIKIKHGWLAHFCSNLDFKKNT